MSRPRSSEGRLEVSAASPLCAADADSQACTYARMLHSVLAPIMIICGDRLQFKNRAANRLISEGVLAVDGASLVRFADAAAQTLLEKVRSQRVHSGTELIRASDGSTMILQIMRIGRAAPQSAHRSARRRKADVPVVVFVTLLSGAGAIRKRAVDGFTLLSKAEKEVLGALVNGHSVGAIAAASERSIATVRWHVKKMLTKTGARSIGDLTRIGSLLAPY